MNNPINIGTWCVQLTRENHTRLSAIISANNGRFNYNSIGSYYGILIEDRWECDNKSFGIILTIEELETFIKNKMETKTTIGLPAQYAVFIGKSFKRHNEIIKYVTGREGTMFTYWRYVCVSGKHIADQTDYKPKGTVYTYDQWKALISASTTCASTTATTTTNVFGYCMKTAEELTKEFGSGFKNKGVTIASDMLTRPEFKHFSKDLINDFKSKRISYKGYTFEEWMLKPYTTFAIQGSPILVNAFLQEIKSTQITSTEKTVIVNVNIDGTNSVATTTTSAIYSLPKDYMTALDIYNGRFKVTVKSAEPIVDFKINDIVVLDGVTFRIRTLNGTTYSVNDETNNRPISQLANARKASTIETSQYYNLELTSGSQTVRCTQTEVIVNGRGNVRIPQFKAFMEAIKLPTHCGTYDASFNVKITLGCATNMTYTAAKQIYKHLVSRGL